MRMPSKKQYNLVTNDEYDSRIPLHPEEAFEQGIRFSAKYIGTLDVPRPTSRVEIVAAMRRIRYEFKAKGIKKKKISLEVSVEGVKVGLRKKKKQAMDDPRFLVMHHPVYRIFYVSHDSQDLKIFSYIARDASSNVFRCNVFKAPKRSQAMRIVRTVGQAFEVCHKISVKDSPPPPASNHDKDISDQCSEASSSDKSKKDVLDSESGQEDLMTLTSDTFNEEMLSHQRPIVLEPLAPPVGSDVFIKTSVAETYTSPLSEPLPTEDKLPPAGTPLSLHHEVQLLREQFEQQQQQTQVAVAQVHLLRDQLAAETAARLESQARTHQLLVHNKELLEHIQTLVLQVRDLELKLQASGIHTTTSQMPPSLQEIKSQLSAGVSSHSSGEAPHTSRFHTTPIMTMHSTQPSATPSFFFPPYLSFEGISASTAAQLESVSRPRGSGSLIPPLPLWEGSVGSGGDVMLNVPQQESRTGAGPRQTSQQMRVKKEDDSSSQSLSSESDLKRDSSCQSSGESVTAALAQLFEPRRLARVPEDGIPSVPYEPLPFGSLKSINGPITRAASERVPRQDTLAQLQRLAWARHTTK